MKTNFTQGPWTFGPLMFTVYGGDPQRRIAVIDYTQGSPSEENQANAKLIAAAPELLRQLQHLCFACEQTAPHIKTDEARAAIEKATS